MFLKRDRIHINGDLDKIKADVVRLEQKFDDHQRAFDKHEQLDEQRHEFIKNDVKQYHTDNKAEHQTIGIKIETVTNKLYWILGIGIAVMFILEKIFESIKITF